MSRFYGLSRNSRLYATILISLGSTNLSAQDREKVYLIADSAQWILAYHRTPDEGTDVCEVATREQPGAIFKTSFKSYRSFTVYLMASSAPPDSFVLQADTKRPIVRLPSKEERTKNVLHMQGAQIGTNLDMLVGASRLHVQVFYPEREKQDLEIDLKGFTPLYWRAIQFDCVPPQVIEELCQSYQKKSSSKLSARPRVCRQFLESKKGRGSSAPYTKVPPSS